VIHDLSKSDYVIHEGEKVQINWLTLDLNKSNIIARNEKVQI